MFVVELVFDWAFVVVVVACVVDEEGDDVGAIVEIEPCSAELVELDGDCAVVLEGVVAAVLVGTVGVKLGSVVAVG